LILPWPEPFRFLDEDLERRCPSLYTPIFELWFCCTLFMIARLMFWMRRLNSMLDMRDYMEQVRSTNISTITRSSCTISSSSTFGNRRTEMVSALPVSPRAEIGIRTSHSTSRLHVKGLGFLHNSTGLQVRSTRSEHARIASNAI
jgi:hypothetical protein